MTWLEPDGSQVVALRFDEPAAADDLARWCGGEVERLPAADDPDTERLVIWVPGPEHPRAAHLGDWVVGSPDGSFRPVGADDFRARYEPAT